MNNNTGKTQPKYELVDLRVVAFIRNSLEIQHPNVASYVRALTRGTVGSPAETVVEHLLSILTKQNKGKFSWYHLWCFCCFNLSSKNMNDISDFTDGE